MKEMALTRGQVAIVDDEDFGWLSQHKWSARYDKQARIFYAVRVATKNNKQTTIYMHREIAAKAGLPRVDHKDGDGLHNWRSNLRPCTQSQNGANSKLKKNSTTGFIGVHFHKGLNRYGAHISPNEKFTHIGLFDSAVEAAKARDAEAKRVFGEFARLNFQ